MMPNRSLAENLALRGDQEIHAFLAALSDQQVDLLKQSWEFHARPNQLAPSGSWRIWLMMTGRGWGKNRALSEWVHLKAEQMPGSHGGLVARTAGDVRDTVVQGISGIVATAKLWNPVEYFPSLRLVKWQNGSTAHTFSSDEPAQLRGPNLHWAAGDEFAQWKRIKDGMGGSAWQNLQLATRLRGENGEGPQICITTTPRPIHALKQILERKDARIVRGSMFENRANLSPEFLAAILDRFGDTRLGAQEISGELVDPIEGALVTQEMIEAARVERLPEDVQMLRGGVAIDPAVSVSEHSDRTGIVGGFRGADGHLYVLPPRSGKFRPDAWARRAIQFKDEKLMDFVVVEKNNGGDMVRSTVRSVDPNVKVYEVTASRGKHIRFEPVAALFEQRRIRLVGEPREFARLEAQIGGFTESGYEGEGSPDDADALVWLAHRLVLGKQRKAAIW